MATKRVLVVGSSASFTSDVKQALELEYNVEIINLESGLEEFKKFKEERRILKRDVDVLLSNIQEDFDCYFEEKRPRPWKNVSKPNWKKKRRK